MTRTITRSLPSTQLQRRIDFLYFFGVPETCYHCTTATEPNQAVSCLGEGDSGQLSPAFREKFLRTVVF